MMKFSKRLFSSMQFIATILHLIQVGLSYALMLAVMTFNSWIYLSMILGFTVGFFISSIFDESGTMSDNCCE